MGLSIKQVMARLLVFFIGLPAVYCIVHFFPQKNHALANLVLTALCAFCAGELRGFFRAKNLRVNIIFACILGALIPLAASLEVSFLPRGLVLPSIFAGVLLITVFALAPPIEDALPLFASHAALLFYPGLPLSAIIFLNGKSSAALEFFLLLVIINDSFAWLFGMLFGKTNRGIVKVSPNKSIAGFAGGIIASCAVGALFWKILPFKFAGASIVIAFITAAAASLGDLAESALKRSAGLKDSGHLFPGRGGALDSLDSIALAAPIFYALYWLCAG